LACHSERSEESRVLTGRIINEGYEQFKYFYQPSQSRDSSSPKKLVQNDKQEGWLLILASLLCLITGNLPALGIEAVAFKMAIAVLKLQA